MTKKIIEYNQVTIERAGSTVLSDVTFSLHQGEMAYLTGRVGSGKTTLLKTLYAQLPIAQGEAHVLDYDLTAIKQRDIPTLRRQLGIVFQDFQLLPDRTVKENLDFVLRSTDWKYKEDREQRIREVLDMVKLQDKLDKRTYELSGGEQQRVCIARAFLNTPQMILADEPTGNLDPENGELILALLDEIRRQNKTAIIVSTHNMQWPEYFPGSIYRCEQGAVTKER